MAKGGTEIQLEDGGWTRLHNRIWELLAQANLTSREFRCLMFLFRQTYGYQKKIDAISLTQWEDGTGIRRNHVKSTLDKLIKRKIVTCQTGSKGRGKTSIYGFNKYYEEWQIDSEKEPTGELFKKNPRGNFLNEKKEPTGVPEKEPTGVPTKERKKQQQPGSRRDSQFVQTFEHCIGRMVASAWESEKIQEWEERVTLPAWKATMEKCAETRPNSFWRYAESILRGYEQNGYHEPQVQTEEPTVVHIDWENF